MTPTRFAMLAAATAVLTCTWGCVGSPQIKGIKAERFAQNAEAVELQITLEVSSTNEAPVELTAWDYSAQVNGRTVYSGSWVAALTVPPKVTMVTQLPVVVRKEDMAEWATAEWSISGSVGYRATRQVDRLLYQLGFNRLSAGFDAKGKGIAEAAGAPVKSGPAQPTGPAAPAGPRPTGP